MDERNQWSTFLAGLLIGVGAGLLLAPETGSQLRKRLRQYASDAQDEMEHFAEEGKAAWDTARKTGQEYAERGADLVNETAKTVRRFAEKAEKAM